MYEPDFGGSVYRRVGMCAGGRNTAFWGGAGPVLPDLAFEAPPRPRAPPPSPRPEPRCDTKELEELRERETKYLNEIGSLEQVARTCHHEKTELELEKTKLETEVYILEAENKALVEKQHGLEGSALNQGTRIDHLQRESAGLERRLDTALADLAECRERESSWNSHDEEKRQFMEENSRLYDMYKEAYKFDKCFTEMWRKASQDTTGKALPDMAGEETRKFFESGEGAHFENVPQVLKKHIPKAMKRLKWFMWNELAKAEKRRFETLKKLGVLRIDRKIIRLPNEVEKYINWEALHENTETQLEASIKDFYKKPHPSILDGSELETGVFKVEKKWIGEDQAK